MSVKTTKLVFEKHMNLIPTWYGFAEQPNGSYKVKVHEMMIDVTRWDRCWVVSESTKVVYCTIGKYGIDKYYVKHQGQMVEIVRKIVKCGGDARNVRWCIAK